MKKVLKQIYLDIAAKEAELKEAKNSDRKYLLEHQPMSFQELSKLCRWPEVERELRALHRQRYALQHNIF